MQKLIAGCDAVEDHQLILPMADIGIGVGGTKSMAREELRDSPERDLRPEKCKSWDWLGTRLLLCCSVCICVCMYLTT